MEYIAQKPTPDQPSLPGVPNVPDQPEKPQLPPDPGAPKTPPPATPPPNTPPPSPSPSPGTQPPVAGIRLLLLILALGFSAIVELKAQSVRYKGDEPTYVMINDSIVGTLMLDNTQRIRLQAEDEAHQARREDLLSQRNDLDEPQFQGRMNTLTQDHLDEVQIILTPEQFERWRSMGGGEEGFAEKAPARKDPTRP